MKYNSDVDITDDMIVPRDHVIKPGYEIEILEALANSLTGSISILDENLDYCFLSPATYTNMGFSADELKVGDNLSDCHKLMVQKGLLSDNTLDVARLSEAQSKSTGNGEVHTQTMRLKTGALKRITRRKLTNGLTVSIACDISDLHEKTQILEETLVLGKSAYWIYDIATKKYDISETFWSYLGEERLEQFNKYGIFSLLFKEDKKYFKDGLAKAIKSTGRVELIGRHKLNAEHIKLNKAKGRDEDFIWAKSSCEVIRDEDGKPIKIRAFVQNITEIKIQEKALEEAKDKAIASSKAKSEFLANMSHEIRTPMNGILGMAELLANTNIDDRQHEFIKVINNSTSSLLTIINDILDFSKIEAGAFELDPMPFDLKDAINDVAALLCAKAHDKGLELIVNYSTNLSRHFIGDGGRIRQIITNLLGNAIKFTEKGHIIIDVDITPSDIPNLNEIQISVKDTGIGIEAEKVDKIFQKFTQADSSTTRIYGGTGLGLSISKHIVEMMGGHMQVESVYGEGSNFICYIPMQLDPNAKRISYETSGIIGKRALIIDDIAINRDLLSEHLEAWNMQSSAVKDGVEALVEIKKAADENNPYDIILLDYLMPGVNGYELASIVSKNQNIPHTPILMLSSCDQPVSSEELKQIGISSYLVKPVREQRLFDVVAKTIGEFEYDKRSKIITSESPIQTPPSIITRETRVDEILFDHDMQDTAAKQVSFDILVAEDFALNQDVVRLMLSETVFNPVFANNGLEAVNLYTENPDRFKIILMDISMPVMDGYEASAKIIEHDKKNNLSPTPIIALTGHALKNDREKCLDAGMNAYLTKPVKQIDLIESLEMWASERLEKSA